MVVRVDAWRECRAEGVRIGFRIVLDVDLEDAGEPDFELNVTILVEAVVEDVFCNCAPLVSSDRTNLWACDPP